MKRSPRRAVGQASSAPRSSVRRMTGKRAYSEGPTYTERSRMRMGVARRSTYPGQPVARTGLSCRLLLRLQQRRRGRDARLQVESRAGYQHVQSQAQHARALAVLDRADGGETHLGRVDQGHAAAALDLHHLVRPDEDRRVLVEPGAHCKGVVGDRGEEPAEAIALAKMLIDDETVGESQAGREPHAAGHDGRALVAAGDHVLAENAGAGAGAADGDAARVAHTDQFGNGGAAEQRREPQLVAAGEKDAARFLEALQPAGLAAVTPRVEVHHRDACRTECTENLLVAGAGLVHAARGRNHDDIGTLAPRDPHEALEDATVVLFVLRAADRDDPPPRLALWHSARHLLLTPVALGNTNLPRRRHGRAPGSNVQSTPAETPVALLRGAPCAAPGARTTLAAPGLTAGRLQGHTTRLS